jgi:hypothetical protein
MTTSPRSTFTAPIGAVVRASVLGKPLTASVTGYTIRTFGAHEHWTDVPCYILGTYGAWPVRDCEVTK